MSRSEEEQGSLLVGKSVMLALEEVAERLDGAGIEWAVFAGAAATVYGATRPLTDVDILVPAAERERVEALFPGSEFVKHANGAHGFLPGIDILAGLPLLDLDEEMAARLRHHEVVGVRVPVIPPEDNILLKAMWGRGADVGKHDWEDVEAMMAFLERLDWPYLRWRAGRLSPGLPVEQALQRLERLWEQKSRA
jgi:hypothetical protein